MQILLSLSFIFTNYLLIESQSYRTQQKRNLLFQYYSGYLGQLIEIRTAAFIIPRYQANSTFYLTGNSTRSDKLHILEICCNIDKCKQCPANFSGN
jgi:hypothetical protein